MNANTPNDVDDAIDRALSTLRDAQPRSGLNGRILTSLEHRTTEPQAGGLHLSARLALWTAAAAAIIAVASMMLLHQHTTGHTTEAVNSSHPAKSVILSEQSESKNPEAVRRTTNSEPFSTTNLAQTSTEPTHRMAHHSAMAAACAQSGCRIQDVAPAVMNAASTTPSDAQLLADLHAPSHPAPPLPLTSEEKLFLHARRYGNLTQLAELNPEMRAKQDADETIAFKAFFPDPPPLKQPLGDTE